MRKHRDIESKVLYTEISWEKACALEIETIESYLSKGHKLLNCNKGGGGYLSLSDQSRKKLADSSRGRKHTEETKRKMSELKIGITTWNKGIPMSEEAKKKLSESKKGRKLTQEHKDKISKSGKGRVVSEEVKKIIGDAHRGKTVSKETREKLSKSNKGKLPWNKGLKKQK
jgi:hypothetical protein